MTGVIILAAGASTRLGKPKQNLIYKGQTLLQRAVHEAIKSKADKVFVVLGANAELIEPCLQTQPVTIVYNADWEKGISTSIVTGIRALQAIDGVNAALIMLCDQPFVNSVFIDDIITLWRKTEASIVASEYNQTIGVPALFSNACFGQLLTLKGDEGAKKILFANQRDVIVIPFKFGQIDIDTESDFDVFCNLDK